MPIVIKNMDVQFEFNRCNCFERTFNYRKRILKNQSTDISSLFFIVETIFFLAYITFERVFRFLCNFEEIYLI